jgi:hypothetical protein
VSQDDAAAPAYIKIEGTTALGPIIGTGQNRGCFIGNEMVGKITPSTYTGTVTLHRWILADAYYAGSTPICQPQTNACAKTNYDDTSKDPTVHDDDPQSGGSAGKVYDIDGPGIFPNQPDGITYRYRGNYYAFAALPDGTRISPFYNYFVRVSCKLTASGYQSVNDVPGDNQIGPEIGPTPTT